MTASASVNRDRDGDCHRIRKPFPIADAAHTPEPSLHSRPSDTPCGRSSIVISTGPKHGVRRNEHTAPQK